MYLVVHPFAVSTISFALLLGSVSGARDPMRFGTHPNDRASKPDVPSCSHILQEHFAKHLVVFLCVSLTPKPSCPNRLPEVASINAAATRQIGSL